MENILLEFKNLVTEFHTEGTIVKAVNGVSFTLNKGETIGIVGESGSGKSVTSLSAMRLIPSPPGKISGGEIIFHEKDGTATNLLAISEEEIRKFRGNDIAMIFQEPMTSLNPVFTVGNQLIETIREHKKISKDDALSEAIELLKSVQIPAPEQRIKEYPHQLSGGMRQRVMIAMALVCDPKVLIADEPTTALDVTVQAQIFDLLKEIQNRNQMSIILITHDFGAINEMADRVIVMYAGYKIEEGPLNEIQTKAIHPYTQGLLKSMLEIKPDSKGFRAPLPEIPGSVPDLLNRQPGCPFGPRCALATEKCLKMPPSFNLGPKRSVMCWLAEDGANK